MFSDVHIFGQIFSDVQNLFQTFSNDQIFCQVADVHDSSWCDMLGNNNLGMGDVLSQVLVDDCNRYGWKWWANIKYVMYVMLLGY